MNKSAECRISVCCKLWSKFMFRAVRAQLRSRNMVTAHCFKVSIVAGPTSVRTNRMARALPRTSQVFRAPKDPPSAPDPATDPLSTPTATPAANATNPPATPAREARTAAETCILELNGENSSPDATQNAQNPNPPLLVNTVNSSAPNPSQFPGMPRVKPMKKLKYEELFWFKRPRLLLTIFQYAYFENALALAILAFAFWKEEYSMIGGGISGSRDKSGFNSKSVSAGLVLLALDVALLVHSSWFVLPMHALTAASVHFSSPQALLEVAKQRNMRLDLVHFIEDAETAEVCMHPMQLRLTHFFLSRSQFVNFRCLKRGVFTGATRTAIIANTWSRSGVLFVTHCNVSHLRYIRKPKNTVH